MSYRKITVDGKEYKYVTGKSHTKVVDVGVVKNTDIGSYCWKSVSPCGDPSCSCDPYEETLLFVITPRDVAHYIKMHIKGFAKDKSNFPVNEPPEGYKLYSTRKIEYAD